MKCISCKEELTNAEIFESLQKFKNGIIHVRGTCLKCKKFALYVPYAESEIVKTLLNEALSTGKFVEFDGGETRIELEEEV